MKLGSYDVPGLYTGDARACMAGLPEACVQAVVCSPPYWGLRRYAGEQGVAWDDGTVCPYGNEPTPEEYVAHTVEILREIHRVLRDDGVCFWNVGDSYWNTASHSQDNVGARRYAQTPEGKRYDKTHGLKHATLKQKDLVLIPHRVAIAAQADGWYVRSDIIWCKTAPMPESVTDRPTSAHEHIWMFTKRPTYFYDADAVRDGGHNLWNYWRLSSEPFGGAHFACFPSSLPGTCIKAATKPGDIVLDPFCGSGTTCAVAEDLGRLWLGFDISEEYRELQNKRTEQVSLVGDLLGSGRP